MQNVVGVRFKKAGKVYYFDPGETPLSQGDAVIVETARGVEYGDVVVPPKPVKDEEVVAPLKKVLRLATEKDTAEMTENRKREQEAMVVCARKIAEHGLEMNLIDCEYTFDGSKIIFYFTSEGRVDFRELVRDLAATFHARIELRQIGVRDEAKMLGGLGPCGRPVCCASFLGDFAPVSIKMAKEQNLSLNPTKISGLCGRLMCCLRYECDHYEQTRAGLPEVGSTVATPDGEGRVVAQNLLRNSVSVEINGKPVLFALEEIARPGEKCCRARAMEEIGTEPTEGAREEAVVGRPEEIPEARPAEARPAEPRERRPEGPRNGPREGRHDAPRESRREEPRDGRRDERREGPPGPHDNARQHGRRGGRRPGQRDNAQGGAQGGPQSGSRNGSNGRGESQGGGQAGGQAGAQGGGQAGRQAGHQAGQPNGPRNGNGRPSGHRGGRGRRGEGRENRGNRPPGPPPPRENPQV